MIISPPLGSEPIVENDKTMTQNFRTLIVQVSNLPVLIGTGSPEGSVEGIQGRMYMDDSGASGSILYIKRDTSVGGDSKKGWILV